MSPVTATRGSRRNPSARQDGAGDGHGPSADKLDTRPIAFTDVDRARQRSVFALYQVITQGLDGTAMPRFDGLPSDDRWALAFYAGHFAFPDPVGGVHGTFAGLVALWYRETTGIAHRGRLAVIVRMVLLD